MKKSLKLASAVILMSQLLIATPSMCWQAKIQHTKLQKERN